jgi:hypothetical protein
MNVLLRRGLGVFRELSQVCGPLVVKFNQNYRALNPVVERTVMQKAASETSLLNWRDSRDKFKNPAADPFIIELWRCVSTVVTSLPPPNRAKEKSGKKYTPQYPLTPYQNR